MDDPVMGDFKQEYEVVNGRAAHYTNTRLLYLAGFIAITGSLVTVGLSGELDLKNVKINISSLLGFFVGILFVALELRATRDYDLCKKRLVELEDILGYKYWSSRVSRGLTARGLHKTLYISLSAFWLLLFLASSIAVLLNL